MQIFIPYPSPIDVAKCLDPRRLNKQILECDQIMKAIVTRQSGATAIMDVYPARPGIPAEALENKILEVFNSFEGVKSDPFISAKIIRKQKPLRAK